MRFIILYRSNVILWKASAGVYIRLRQQWSAISQQIQLREFTRGYHRFMERLVSSGTRFSALELTWLISYSVKFRCVGVGYYVHIESHDSLVYLVFNFGYSHKIYVNLPHFFQAKLLGRKKRVLALFGFPRTLLVQFGSMIRSLQPFNKYVNKGFRYWKERIYIKEGKKKFV